MSQLRDAARPALPEDAANATLAGRVWRPDVGGPSIVALRNGACSTSRGIPRPCATCASPPIRP